MFNLEEYIPRIKEMATANNCTVEDALEMFVVNLITMKNHYKGCADLNFHVLGQQWNSLTSDNKVLQKSVVEKALTKKTRTLGV